MQILAKTDYAIRALLALADRHPELVKIDAVADDQKLPPEFARTIAGELRRAGLVRIQRGAHGGWHLARAPHEISVGQVFRATDGPFIELHGSLPSEVSYFGAATRLPQVWAALQQSVEKVLDQISLADLLAGPLPALPEATDSR